MATRLFPYLTLTLLLIMCVACNSPKNGGGMKDNPDPAHNSRNALDWQGIYSGVLPCADCEGIRTVLTLKEDGTFELMQKYLGKADDVVDMQRGQFEWNEAGTKISLSQGGAPGGYQVGENRLWHLDETGRRMEGDLADMYQLYKMNDQVKEKYWKLIELNGKAISYEEGQNREAHLILKEEEGKAIGNGGCNSFFGTYEIDEATLRLSFGMMGATKMACMDMEIEDAFFRMLEMVDNYAMKGDTLSLHKARMAPLARFEAVYLY